jgi:hypothetical protein
MNSEETYGEKFFLEFAKEILLYLRAEHRKELAERKEKERIEKEIEAHKIREKFIPKIEEEQKKPPQIQEIKKEIPKIIQQQVIQKPQTPIQIIPKPTISPQQPQPIPQIQQPKILPPLPQKEVEKKYTEEIKPENEDKALPELFPEKMMGLIKDKLITYIECPGQNQALTIKKSGNTLKTNVYLEKEEIDQLIEGFSQRTRIPLVDGMLTARHINFEISAISSDSIGSSFILKKIQDPSNQIIEAPRSNLINPFAQRQKILVRGPGNFNQSKIKF